MCSSDLNPEQRPRSVFLVGDEKQSIYSFRRANPALQEQASRWLAENLNAQATPLDFSRRSSSAIIHSVNQVFEQEGIKQIMTGYITHDTHLSSLPGRVQLCELFDEDGDETESTETIYFRNPLNQPREISYKTRRHDEADYIAKQILQIINTPILITDNGQVRAAEFGDILILMRNRTHVDIYEKALKQHDIAYIGNKKGGLLDNLEIQDLNCLLNTLITPFNNLALAQVLKSPVFSASDKDLIQLSQLKGSPHWYQRLLLQAEGNINELSKPLQRAAHLLPRWQQLAEQLPVHDCLDKIFSEGNIIKRYMAANQPENKQKVASNCLRFLELSLETDSGRYPGITRFLQQLTHLKNHSESPPEEPLSQSNESRVRLMTIHGSKGLEAPIVFLADCNSIPANKNAYAPLIRWPASQSRPSNFQLQLSKDNTDQITHNLQQEKLNEQKREELNLLYVALTRAREQLYISGTASGRKQENSWYQIIASGLESITQPDTTVNNINCTVYEHLSYDTATRIEKAQITTTKTTTRIDERLLKPIKTLPVKDFILAPSLVTDEYKPDHSLTKNDFQKTTPDLARWRGTIIHKVLEKLCNSRTYPASDKAVSAIQSQLKIEILRDTPDHIKDLDECIEEAVNTYNHNALQPIFNPAIELQTYNEMPLMYLNKTESSEKTQAVYGVVDRLIKSENEILIIDYKSHHLESSDSTQTAAQQFSKQLAYYKTRSEERRVGIECRL